MSLTTFSVVIAVAFVVLHGHLRKLFGGLTSFMSAALEAGEGFLDEALSSLLAWLRQPGVPQAVDVFKVAVILLFGLAAGYGDFIVLRKTLVVVLPWQATGTTVAATLVLVGSLVAFIAHTQESSPRKVGLIALALLFIGIEGVIAYVRTTEINRIEAIQSAYVDDGSRGLSIENRLADAEPTSASRLRKGPSDGPFPWMPLVASTIAVLLGTGLICAFWGALSIRRGLPLVWICACPLLIAFVTSRATLVFLRRSKVIDSITTILDALADSSTQLWNTILAVRRSLSADAFRSRRQASEEQTVRNWMKSAKLQAKKEIQRVRLTSEIQEYRDDLPKILETVRSMRIAACVTARQRLIRLLEQATLAVSEIDATLDEAELFCGFEDKGLLPSKMQAIHGQQANLGNGNGREDSRT